jgi:hypothetical protein
MKYYNSDLDIGKSDESVHKDLLTNVKKSIIQSLKHLSDVGFGCSSNSSSLASSAVRPGSSAGWD